MDQRQTKHIGSLFSISTSQKRNAYHPEVKRRLVFVSPEVVLYEADICKEADALILFLKQTVAKFAHIRKSVISNLG